MINFIAKPPFEMKHLQRVSSIIRGEQIAAYIGNARLNPPNGSEDDIYIYVKPHIKPGNDFYFEKHSWIDIQDGYELKDILYKNPDVGVIVFSELDMETLTRHIHNRMVLIPHHHCNFERDRRERKGITRVGITGTAAAFPQIPDVIRQGLKDRNIELVEYSTFYPRMSVARFHKSIDIHLQWRPYPKQLSCPLKITNAASFGVPTIALDIYEPSFKEMEGAYIGVKSSEEWLEKLDYLIENPDQYAAYSQMGLDKSERYHIENIAKLYERLT
jgi:hypothetical protein